MENDNKLFIVSSNDEKKKRKYSEVDRGVENTGTDWTAADDSGSEQENDPDWEHSFSVLPQQQTVHALCGFEIIGNRIKSKKHLRLELALNEQYVTDTFCSKFHSSWTDGKNDYANGSNTSVQLISSPFRLCIVDNVIENVGILAHIREQMYEMKWNKRHMDLYEFLQSDDLGNLKHYPLVEAIYNFLNTSIKSWIEKMTGLHLERMSATCSAYSDTDYLLVHDDRRGDRLIAFIWYVSEEVWTPEMGGVLQMFASDQLAQPTVPLQTICPKSNRFVFFQVTHNSYHQVTEILHMDHCRMSINGWFHSTAHLKPDEPFVSDAEESNEFLSPLSMQQPPALDRWIQPNYLQDDVKQQIQQHIETESEISLQQFFQMEPLHLLCQSLDNNEQIKWQRVGPPNRRNYEVVCRQSLPTNATELLSLFQSERMFRLLHEYTDLDLSGTGIVRIELQRWTPGCYSLFSEDLDENSMELDVIAYLGCEPYLGVVGGHILYVSTDERTEDALVTMQPQPNTLNIVCRDTQRIVKYISHRTQQTHFYVLFCSYREQV